MVYNPRLCNCPQRLTSKLPSTFLTPSFSLTVLSISSVSTFFRPLYPPCNTPQSVPYFVLTSPLTSLLPCGFVYSIRLLRLMPCFVHFFHLSSFDRLFSQCLFFLTPAPYFQSFLSLCLIFCIPFLCLSSVPQFCLFSIIFDPYVPTFKHSSVYASISSVFLQSHSYVYILCLVSSPFDLSYSKHCSLDPLFCLCVFSTSQFCSSVSSFPHIVYILNLLSSFDPTYLSSITQCIPSLYPYLLNPGRLYSLHLSV